MKTNLFRKKNIERVASPEQLDDYIRVSSPSSWAILGAFAILLVGICVWGIFGRLDTTLPVVAVKESGSVVCYVKDTDQSKVEIGMTVEVNGEEFVVTGKEKNPVLVDSSFHEYAKYVGDLNDGEWIYYVYTDCSAGAEGEVFPAEILIERINPLYFVTN